MIPMAVAVINALLSVLLVIVVAWAAIWLVERMPLVPSGRNIHHSCAVRTEQPLVSRCDSEIRLNAAHVEGVHAE